MDSSFQQKNLLPIQKILGFLCFPPKIIFSHKEHATGAIFLFCILIFFVLFCSHVDKFSVSHVQEFFFSPPRATPFLTFLSLLKWQKSGKSRLTKCVKKLCVRLKSINLLKNLVQNYVENYGRKVLWKIVLKS